MGAREAVGRLVVVGARERVVGVGAQALPPVVVDETADIAAAGAGIVAGASLDNNVVCIVEKEVFVDIDLEAIGDLSKFVLTIPGGEIIAPEPVEPRRRLLLPRRCCGQICCS